MSVFSRIVEVLEEELENFKATAEMYRSREKEAKDKYHKALRELESQQSIIHNLQVKNNELFELLKKERGDYND